MLKTKLTLITASAGNDLCCSAHIPGVSVKSLRSYFEVYGSCFAVCVGVWEKSHCIRKGTRNSAIL
jgi:hypothetical protein